ncbi:MAG: ribonuclease R [Xanthomonadales bacterium]|nr:ribonuclease R [Xanthomonadales bacterium]
MTKYNPGGKNRHESREINAIAPERNEIIAMLEKRGQPMQRKDLVRALKVESDDSREILRRRLRAMVRDGQLVQNRRRAFGLPARMDLVKGRISSHRDGYGFLIPDDSGTDLYISSREMRKVLHGDRVLAAVTGTDRQGRREGKITEVLERANDSIVGRYVEENGIALVVPDDPRINQDVMIPLNDTLGARPGQVVVATIVTEPTGRKSPVGKITEILGQSGAPGMATEIAIRSHGLPFEWPDGVEAAAEAFGESVPEEMKTGRKDLRQLPLVTIDGADARDFDDAVYARKQSNGWRLIVAIAEVSSYVQPGSPLDDEAVRRATSVYFPSRVIPMLPEALSNGLCSLKPAVDRLCLACEITVSDNGTVQRSRFVAAVMNSSARLTYQQVADYFESGVLKHHDDMDDVKSNLDDLHALYKTLLAARLKRGAIGFESTEYGFQFDQRGGVAGLVAQERNDAHKLIEECMILANVEAARFLLKNKLPAPYRVHASPPEGKLEALGQFLRGQGMRVPWRDDPQPKDFEEVVLQAQGRPDEHLIMAVLLRSQSLAAYQPGNEGHFGLALDAYTHFTSPIRRYPDLLVHRAIHHLLQRSGTSDYPYSGGMMSELCARCSFNARRAEEAERDVVDRLKCAYLETRIGEEFEGLVSGVTSFGLFVELDYGRISGLVHVTGLPNDYYHFDPVAHRMKGERTGRVFQLSDRVKVRVVSVNLDERKIDFELVE